MRKVLIVIVALVLLAVGVGLAGFEWADGSAHEPVVADDVVFTVPKGAFGPHLLHLLDEAGIVKNAFAAKVYLKLHPPAPPRFGRHQLKKGMSLIEVLAALAENPLPEDAPVTIVEGWRLADTDKALAELGPNGLKPGEYLKAAKDPAHYKIPFDTTGADNLEGYLYPETYMMPVDHIQAERLIQRQLDAFNERFAVPYAAEIKKSGHSLRELVIVASLLEKEEPDVANRPTTAGLIYRRLQHHIKLGVDATSRYTLEDWNDHKGFLAKLRDKSDPYNTREREGLPPGPLCSPTLQSLLAALRPVKSEYLYYLHDKDHHVHYARTAAEHEANRKKYDVY